MRKILIISGLDTLGTAGMIKDLAVCTELKVHPYVIPTTLIPQDPKDGIIFSTELPLEIIKKLLSIHNKVDAIKIGLITSEHQLRIIIDWLSVNNPQNVVFDPVVKSTLDENLTSLSIKDLYTLLPHVSLITPNLQEAQELSGIEINDTEDMLKAAEKIYKEFGCAVLIKGGHLPVNQPLMDILYNGNRPLRIYKNPVEISLRGSGCILSTAISVYLARGFELDLSVLKATRFIYQKFRSQAALHNQLHGSQMS